MRFTLARICYLAGLACAVVFNVSVAAIGWSKTIDSPVGFAVPLMAMFIVGGRALRRGKNPYTKAQAEAFLAGYQHHRSVNTAMLISGSLSALLYVFGYGVEHNLPLRITLMLIATALFGVVAALSYYNGQKWKTYLRASQQSDAQ